MAAAKAVVLSTMVRALVTWCAALSRQSLGTLSSALALKTVAASSCAQQLFGDVHHGVIGSGFGCSWHSTSYLESVLRALLSSALFAAFAQRTLGVRGRRAGSPDLIHPYGPQRLLMLDSGLPWWLWMLAPRVLLLGTVGRGPGLVGGVVGKAREGPTGRYIGGAR